MSVLEIVASLSGIVIASLLSFFAAVAVANRSSKAEVDDKLWTRANSQLAKMSKRIDALEKLSDTQQAEIVALENKLTEQETAHTVEIKTMASRIDELEKLLEAAETRAVAYERENARLKRENGQLKKGQGKRRI